MVSSDPKLRLADRTELTYTLGGAVSMLGDMYIDIPNITLAEAVAIFSNTEKTKHMEFWAGGTVTAYDNYTVLGGVEKPYNQENIVRVTMRKGANATEEALIAAQSEAAQYKAALELLGIDTKEVNAS